MLRSTEDDDIGAAFTLLRLTGRIDHDGTRLALRGLEAIKGLRVGP